MTDSEGLTGPLMLGVLTKLQKVLRLEKSLGYRNQAVIGGLEAFTPVWRAEALAATLDGTQIKQVNEIAERLEGYAQASGNTRVQTISDLMLQIEQAMGPSLREGPVQPSQPGVREPTPVRAPEPTVRQAEPPSAARMSERSRVSESLPSTARRPGSGLDAPVGTLPGIKTGYAQRFERLGIATVGDLLHHYPHRYDDYSKLKSINSLEYGEEATIIGVVWETHTRTGRGGAPIVHSIVADGSGTIEVVWFNQPYMAKELRAGRRIVLSGKVTEHLGRLTLQSPAWEPLERELIHTGRLVPVYPLTHGISARWLRRLMKQVVDHWSPRLEDYLPAAVRRRKGLLDLSAAIRQIHFPDSLQAAEEARRRLSFDEFLLIQLGMMSQRRAWQAQGAVPIPHNEAQLEAFLQSLPFELTAAQRHSLDQVTQDLAQSHPMSRMLQGDVGSGKTVVAAAAMLMVVAAGKQAALMAPTEILAEQHYRTISELLGCSGDWGLDHSMSVVLLTGSLSRAERSRAYGSIASGQADIAVGTHALIQRNVDFRDLALVVVDEQHRFGVIQRAALRGKGSSPHVLVMSATPIPRSLALTLYGDLDISVIDELPPGRQPIQTRWLLPRERERAYAFLEGQIKQGRQAFVLYPLIEESDKLQVKAATEEYERLQQTVFPTLRLGLLHGRMPGSEKDRVMTCFREGELDILVSTSVIEVGIDVPNATVMLIESADRFGLAQLHQFRGRVGRGPFKSYCLLVSDNASPDDPQTKSTWERLKAIEETQDGFVLAEKDLELRGPGDFFGVRQSGLPTLRLARLSNLSTLEEAREEAKAIFLDDPTLSRQENGLLSQQVARFWRGEGDLS